MVNPFELQKERIKFTNIIQKNVQAILLKVK